MVNELNTNKIYQQSLLLCKDTLSLNEKAWDESL